MNVAGHVVPSILVDVDDVDVLPASVAYGTASAIPEQVRGLAEKRLRHESTPRLHNIPDETSGSALADVQTPNPTTIGGYMNQGLDGG